MPFDLKKFDKAKFEDRKEFCPLQGFQEGWFSEGETPGFTVKGLNGIELTNVEVAASKYTNVKKFSEMLSQLSSNEQVLDAFAGMIGVGDAEPNDVYAKICETLRFGVIEPDFNFERAVRFVYNLPIDAMGVYRKISELTGKGRTPGESKPSGDEQKSTTP